MASQRAGYRVDALRFDMGAAWLNLLATVGNAYGPAPVERLSSVDRLAQWLEHENLTPGAPPRAADVVHARAVRETLRPLGLAAAAGRTPAARELTQFNALLAEDLPLFVRSEDGRLTAEPPTTAAALARVAREAAERLTSTDAGRLRTCDDHECGLLFLDLTGRRRWCSAEICGVRHRVRAHRQRLRP